MSEIKWYNEYSKQFLEQGYLLSGQTVENRIKVIGDYAEKILKESLPNGKNNTFLNGYSDKLQQYIKNGWISLSTPIWINFGTKRGLGISCFGSYFEDSIQSILDTNAEIGTMTKYGGGTSGYLGAIRGRGSIIKDNGVSNGTFPFLEYTQSTTNVISQGSSRRGYFAGYIDINHPDFDEWLEIRSEGNPIQQITWGACVPTWWLNEMREGNPAFRERWAKVIQKKFETGLPYVLYTDNANNGENVPEVYKNKNRIKASNMCCEIMNPSSPDESFVCDISSLVDVYFEEYSKTDCIEVITMLLDAVCTDFIQTASTIKHMERAVKFATRHRSLGIGRLGYHSLLQSKMMPFESLQSRYLNIEISKTIFEQAMETSKKLAEIYGEPDELIGIGRRNTNLIAIAPTKSSSFIMGQFSEGIEPNMSNFYTKDLAKGKFTIKNRYLTDLLESKDKNNDEVWKSIMINQGSVLHLDFLTNEEKAVFKTAREINQDEIILQAAQRQKYIDQGQSLNLFITADTTAKEVNNLMLKAHDMGLKSLYYQHNVGAASELSKQLYCVNCE